MLTTRALGSLSLVLCAFSMGCAPSPAASEPSPSSQHCHYVDEVLPDPSCTPGAVDPSVTQDDIATTICVRGYTARVRPPTSYTGPLKDELLREYGQDPSQRSKYELDHLVPLELGGAPRDPKNLWPEPGIPNRKDRIENELHDDVCSGRITLAEAQQRMETDWRGAR